MLFTLGINHRSAPLAIREQVCFQPKQLPQVLAELIDTPAIHEAAILSTCNRTELYCLTTAPECLALWLASHHGLEPDRIRPYLYTLPQEQVIPHAFRVACGLDSMVLGEPQILGQMKEAVRAAEEAGSLGPHLHKLFQHAFHVAKEVRSTTAVGANVVSMAAACVHLSQAHVGTSLDQQRVMFVGSGEMIELCATHFFRQQPARITFVCRHPESATAIARRVGGHLVPLCELEAQLTQHDILISCTASPQPLLTLARVQKALAAEAKHRPPLLMIDLAVPRDIEPAIGTLPAITLYSIDDLAAVVARGRESRQAAVQAAESIIREQARRFDLWLERRANVHLVRSLRDSAERMRRRETERAIRLLAAGKDPGQVMEQLSQRLTNKLLHAPTTALNLAEGEAKTKLRSAAIRLFHLHK